MKIWELPLFYVNVRKDGMARAPYVYLYYTTNTFLKEIVRCNTPHSTYNTSYSVQVSDKIENFLFLKLVKNK